MSVRSYIQKKNSEISKRFKQKLLSAGIVATGTGAGVAALAGVGSAAINTTAIIGLITDATTIFPSLGDMVVAIVPTILTLCIVGFVTGFFDKILNMIDRFIH